MTPFSLEDDSLGLFHVVNACGRTEFDNALPFAVMEESLKGFQQVADVLRLPALPVHHGEKLLNVDASDRFSVSNVVLFCRKSL